MKGTAKIIVVLGTVVLVLGAVLFLASKTSAHFEKITLDKAGVVMDSNVETAQFSTGDVLYRMWNEEEMIDTATGTQKRQILTDNILFFEDNDILFTDKFTVIDTNGLTEKTRSRVVYNLNSEGSYTADNSVIAENSIVKLAKRMYFLNAAAKVYFGEEEVTTVDRPLLLIDKTGSVIVYDVPTKKRYLGHLTLVVDEKKRFDVSDEKYYVDDRVIDLASFGGTDNKKLVLESSSSSEIEKETKSSTSDKKNDTEDSLSAERNYSIENSASGTDNNQLGLNTNSDGSTGANGAGTSSVSNTEETNSNVSQGSSNSGSFITLKDYQALLDKIDKLNKKSEKAIPVLTLNYINPEVTNISYNYQIIDVDHTLVGSPKVELIKNKSDEVVDTAYISPTSSIEAFTGLVPNTAYYLRFTYQYDLGKGEGVQSLEVKSNPFETTKVEAVYQLKHVNSDAMTIKASLDQQMSDLSRVRLKITAEDGTSFSIEGNTNLISNGGQEFTISDLLPETKYQYQLELFLTSGESLLLKESKQYQTLAGTILNTLDASVTENNLIEVAYDWTSVDYQLQDVSLKLVNATTEYTIPYRIVGQSDEGLTVVPLIEGDYSTFSVQLNLNVLKAESTKSEVLTYDDDTIISYNKNASSVIRQQNTEFLTFGISFDSNFNALSEGIDQPEITTDSSLMNSETTDSEQLTETNDLNTLNEQNDNYMCILQWTAPTEAEYTVVTERKEKQQSITTPLEILSQKENWQAFDSQTVAVSENNILKMALELSKLSVDTFEFRQAIYDNNGTLMMYVYSRE
jgi:chitodextrinase